MMKKFSVALLALAAALAIAPAAFADSIPGVVFNDQTTSPYATQGWTGNLASVFTVNSPVTVTALGIYNPTGNGKVTGLNNIEVALYDITTGQQIGSTVTFVHGDTYTTGGLYGLDVFQSISATTLQPGLYEVDAVGFNSAYSNGNTGIAGPGPTFDGYGQLTWPDYSYFDYNSTLDFPDAANNSNGGYKDAHIYDAGTLAILTPEPSSLLLLGTGLLGLAFVAFRKTKSSGLVLHF
jgi:hypothetical protein